MHSKRKCSTSNLAFFLFLASSASGTLLDRFAKKIRHQVCCFHVQTPGVASFASGTLLKRFTLKTKCHGCDSQLQIMLSETVARKSIYEENISTPPVFTPGFIFRSRGGSRFVFGGKPNRPKISTSIPLGPSINKHKQIKQIKLFVCTCGGASP
jgi:hypothetical protein